MRPQKWFLISIFALAAIIGFPIPSQAQKARTVDELSKMYDVSTCKACHTKIYEEWEKSIHARSLVGTGRTAATIRTAILDGLMKEQTKSGVKEIKDIKVEHLMMCAKCHLPQLKDATDEVAQQLAKAAVDLDIKTLEKVNINCLICHNTHSIIHKWHDGLPEKGVVYGTKDGSHPDKAFPTMKKTVIMKESAMCGQCHGLGPNFDLPQPIQCATLYGSYLHAYIPAGGTETCHDCHIKKYGKGHLMPSYRDPDIAQGAVTMEVSILGYKFLPKAGDPRPTALVTVKLTSNAGHRIPDG